MPESMKSLSVIAAVYDVEDAKRCLPSISEAYRDYDGTKEFIFIDICQTNKLKEFILENYPFVNVIKAEKDKISKAFNSAAGVAKNEILFFINGGVELESRYFKTFSDYFKKDEIFALSGCGWDIKNKRQLFGLKAGRFRYGFLKYRDVFNDKIKKELGQIRSFGLQDGCFFVSAKKFRVLGGFDDIFDPLLNVSDLSYRAMKQGWNIMYKPDLASLHTVGDKTFPEKVLHARNNIIFTWKNVLSAGLANVHALFLGLRILTLNLPYLLGFLKALRLFKVIKHRRKIEARKAVFSDRQILTFFKNYFSEILERTGN
jgi:GT2 family glycosyltransferase